MIGALHIRGRRTLGSRHTAVEVLEGRTLLSGDVAALQAGTELDISGDNLGNWIKVYSGSGPHEVIVVGENYTRVNGSYNPRHFYGIEDIRAGMNGGNDSFKALCLDLSQILVGANLLVDGGRGDDCILVADSTIHAENNLDNRSTVILFGEQADAQALTNTGNDTIEINNTAISARGGETAATAVQMVGDDVAGGQVSGGNDHLTIAGSCIVAADATFSNSTSVDITGDRNVASGGTILAPETSKVGVGNDCITISCSQIKAVGCNNDNNSTSLTIVGDDNSAFGLAVGTIGQGDDTISVSGSTISASGIATGFGNSTSVTVTGDRNNSEVGSTATVGSGNDCVSFCDTAITATDATLSNSTFLQVSGDDNSGSGAKIGGGNDNLSFDQLCVTASGATSTNNVAAFINGDSPAPGSALSQIVGGNDTISLTNSNLIATGALGSAFAQIEGDDSPFAATTTVGQGNDRVTMACTRIEGQLGIDLRIETAKGRDFVVVQGSTFGRSFFGTEDGNDVMKVLNNYFDTSVIEMGSGDDDLYSIGNTFVTASLDGGPGYDRLFIHDNSGIVVIVLGSFEEIHTS